MTQYELIKKWRDLARHLEDAMNDERNAGSVTFLATLAGQINAYRSCANDLEAMTY